MITNFDKLCADLEKQELEVSFEYNRACKLQQTATSCCF